MGRFESANGGTIFLDEVGDLPAEIHATGVRVRELPVKIENLFQNPVGDSPQH